MPLTQAQLVTLKANIIADPDTAVQTAYASNNDTELARLYNLDSTFVVWKTDALKRDIFGAISWKSMTPVDVADGTVIQTNRSLACQGKQFVLQTMLISPGESLDMGITNIRNGIKDALQELPSGTAGALLDAGWTAVKTASTRFANKTEKVFAIGTGTTGTPGNLTFVGLLTIDDLGRMRSV